ncbi:MAG: CoA pyrophosphatase [Candidatus Marinimicrobia bacterium]|jgi:8-oxo-dGTP pyrophosphatase MutT (NUDIX family)|nr:CoA pyrophosphatase [Candidatus Neomarinimicrobiota bacterium]MBT4663119.1 CoA pyrophosphatase [Candidatus Neomarinimicrobiota bacterium]MBT5224422.1 CoA pyrophosphatase [Candidatus Neomarinimicrobiota bacterium]MBT5722360.1 CoA pyrophosphatase [Candidatus Neomarinimicrobiota bacterium]MBT6712072.1 CoA pyrophosphatase [Candidatus Neomarinimicrobiota bacterium]
MESLFIKNLSNRLSKDLPGKSAHDTMMVTPRLPFPKINLVKKGIPASVLILLFPKNNQWHFFLTKRTNTVNHHKGQISLPGGVVETGESLEGAALRETHEEIGVDKKNIHLIGSLSSFYIPVSGFEMFPFIGWVKTEPETSIHDKEVDRIFSSSIPEFMLDKTQKTKKDTLKGFPVNIPYFDMSGETVWGATSMILAEFKLILKEIL